MVVTLKKPFEDNNTFYCLIRFDYYSSTMNISPAKYAVPLLIIHSSIRII